MPSIQKKKRIKKRQKIKIARQKVKRCSTQLAMCRDNKITHIDSYHYDWWSGRGRHCNCMECADLYAPGTVIGVIISGSIRRGKKLTGRVFVDLCNQRCWNLIDTKDGIELDHKTHVRVDGEVIERIVAKVEDKLSADL